MLPLANLVHYFRNPTPEPEIKPSAVTPGRAAYISSSQLFWSFSSNPQNTLCWAAPRGSRNPTNFHKIPLQCLVSLEAPLKAAGSFPENLMGRKSYPRTLKCQRGSPGADLPILCAGVLLTVFNYISFNYTTTASCAWEV